MGVNAKDETSSEGKHGQFTAPADISMRTIAIDIWLSAITRMTQTHPRGSLRRATPESARIQGGHAAFAATSVTSSAFIPACTENDPCTLETFPAQPENPKRFKHEQTQARFEMFGWRVSVYVC
jgi:hypothetical protein